MSSRIKRRLARLEQREEQKEQGGVIVISGPRDISPEEWETVAVDYMERVSKVAAGMKKKVNALHPRPGGGGLPEL